MKYWSLIWKILTAVLGVALGITLLLLVAAAGVLITPSIRTAILNKGVEIANEQTDLDIDLGRLYLSPFHHSPMLLYRAYKGDADLPLRVEVDSLFVGHRGQDTLIYVHSLRLDAQLQSAGKPIQDPAELLALPIAVNELHLDQTTFHSDSLIAAVGIDAIVGNLDVRSPELIIAKGQYPLHGLRLDDAYGGIDLRETPPDTTAQDTTPTLMAFDVPDGELKNIHFALTPMDMHVRTDKLSTNVLADVGANLYDARRLDVENISLALGELFLPFDTLCGDARVELSSGLITSRCLHVRSDSLGAVADLSATRMNLNTMRVDVTADADYRGSKVSLRGYYDIDDEAYAIQAQIDKVDLSSPIKDNPHVVLAGELSAEGKGINPKSPKMCSKVQLALSDAQYEQIDVSGIRLDAELANGVVDGSLHLPVSMQDSSLTLSTQSEHQFSVAQFMKPEKMQVDYHAQLRHTKAHVGGEDWTVDSLDIAFTTADTTTLTIGTGGLSVAAESPMHVMRLVDGITRFTGQLGKTNISLSKFGYLDSLRRQIPDLDAQIVLTKGSPAQHMIESFGVDIDQVKLSLRSDAQHTDLTLDASTPAIDHPEDSTALRLPAATATAHVALSDGKTDVSLMADSKLTDGAMMVRDLKTDAALRFDIKRRGDVLTGAGCLMLDSLALGDIDLGSRSIDVEVSQSDLHANALRADVRLDDIPLDLVDSIIHFADLDLQGAVRARAVVDGLPKRLDLSAEVLPLDVSATYKPLDAKLSLGEIPIVMEHNMVDFNGLPIYGADSTYLSLTGGLDLESQRLDIVLAADSFAPIKLVKDGPIPVHGGLAVDINGRVTGALDSIQADVDVTILPSTDVTYQIDKKNLAQVKPHGTVNVKYNVADGDLNLGGRVDVDEGMIRYSPKAYPIMPFKVDSGSHIAFNGPVGRTMVNVSASQKTKSSVQAEGEDSRMVEFNTGVRVRGEVDSIGLNAISFFLEAPDDEAITNELASVDEDTREGYAATLLATGMYMGESNTSVQNSGYALTSIINSRINAAMANSKRGKVVDLDLSRGQSQHASGESNDLNIAISKSFFNDRLKLSLGAALSDNPEVYTSTSFLNNLSAEFKLTKDGNVLLRAFGQRDYNNILEGELIKSGIGVRATQQWSKTRPTGRIRNQKPGAGALPDSLTRTYGLVADADVAWRSNNSLGPNLTLTAPIKNIFGHDETFTIKANGAYYWALRDRHPGDPKSTDTYKLGVSTALVFPYLHWAGNNVPEGDTRYMLGYQYENIAGGYGVNKEFASLTYFLRSSRYITHSFTPFSLSIVTMNVSSDSVYSKAMDYPQLIKLMAGNEFVPAIGYHFIYNDYRSKRAVNTMLDLGVKEAGNLINALYCAFGHKWDEKKKPLGTITYDQFVKLTAELRNKYNITDEVCIATRLFAGANIPLGNSTDAPLSEAFYAGGPNNMRASSPYAYGPGNFYSTKYNQNFFHAGDVKLEANFELRFPIVWKLFGAAFVDAGNVWTWRSSADLFTKDGIDNYKEVLGLLDDLYDGIYNNPYLLKQIALGTGAGVRLDLDGLVIRLDIGVAIHTPYQTYKRDKELNYDITQPINTYFNQPTALDAIRVNFGIGYPF